MFDKPGVPYCHRLPLLLPEKSFAAPTKRVPSSFFKPIQIAVDELLSHQYNFNDTHTNLLRNWFGRKLHMSVLLVEKPFDPGEYWNRLTTREGPGSPPKVVGG